MTPETQDPSLTEPEAPASSTSTAELLRLRKAAVAILLFLGACGAASGITIVLMLDGSRTSDLRRLAVISLLSGVVGAAARGVLETIERLGAGWELGNGTQINRRDLRKQRFREEIERRAANVADTVEAPATSHRRRSHTAEVSDEDATRQQRAEQHVYDQTEDPQYQRRELEQDEVRDLAFGARSGIDIYFGAHILPFLIALPFVGAVLGLALFAGVTGGLLWPARTRLRRIAPRV